MVEPRIGEDVVKGPRRAGFRIERSKHKTRHPRMDHGAGTHHAGFDRAIHRHAQQSIISQFARGFAQGDDFSMRRRIVCRDRTIESAAGDNAVRNDDGSHRYFSKRLRFFRFRESQIHILLVNIRVHECMLHLMRMKFLAKVGLLFCFMPAALLAQPGVRMSADFLPLEVGHRWVYDVLNEGGQKIDDLDFAVQEHRIVGGRSFYLLTQFPFVSENAGLTRLVRYDRQERQYVRMADNEEGPLFLADGTSAEVLQADESGLPIKFILHMDLMDLTFQRGMGIIEARMRVGNTVRIAKLTGVRLGDRKAAEAAAQGAPTLPPPKSPEQKTKALADNVAVVSDENPALDVTATDVSGGLKFVLTVVNTSDKLLPFSFRTSQSYDFAVIDSSTGQEVWRWSRRMFFTQVIRQEAVRPNRNWTFEETWNRRDNDLEPVTPGKYKVVGIVSTEPPIESEPFEFEVK
jgi:hypothetical protein